MDLKALYTLAEYARMTGQKINAVRAQADRGHLPTVLFGKRRFVTLAYLQVEMPDLFRSICLKAQIEAATEHVAPPARRPRRKKDRRQVAANVSGGALR